MQPKLKKFLIFITAKNGDVLIHQVMSFADIKACNTYYFQLIKTDQYLVLEHLVCNTHITEIFDNSELPAAGTIKKTFLENCKNCDFTKRETRVALEMRDGKSNSVAAKKLNIAVGTLETHITHINQKTKQPSLKKSIIYLNSHHPSKEI